MPPTHKVRIFRYLDELDAFDVTEMYRDIADTLGLAEWTPVVWIGRLFSLDNDYGEHWFDNWELREQKGLSQRHLLIDPMRFKDDRDGPCHPPEFRKRFWTDVLQSLELSFDLICDEARRFNERRRELLQQTAFDPEEGLIADLEGRIERLRATYFG
jgi:hypothetical protein